MRTISTLACACNQAGNTELVADILAGMDAKTSAKLEEQKKKKRKGFTKSLNPLLRSVGALPPDGEGSEGGENAGSLLLSVAVLLGVGAAAGAGVAKFVAKGPEKPAYTKGAAIGAASAFGLAYIGSLRW